MQELKDVVEVRDAKEEELELGDRSASLSLRVDIVHHLHLSLQCKGLQRKCHLLVISCHDEELVAISESVQLRHVSLIQILRDHHADDEYEHQVAEEREG